MGNPLYGGDPEILPDGEMEQLRTDISLIQELAVEASNFEDFKLRLRDQIKKMDRKSWF